MKSEIIISSIGVIGTILGTVTAWHLGKKQTIKKDTLDPISRGADSLISTSERMLKRLEEALDKEQEHKENCESRLKQQDEKIKELYKQINEIKKGQK